MRVEPDGTPIDRIDDDRASAELLTTTDAPPQRIDEQMAAQPATMLRAIEREPRQQHDWDRVRHPATQPRRRPRMPDNALAESFVDSLKTELIADRVWRTRTQLELAVVEYVAWFNTVRLHTSIGMRPPVEHEAEWRRLASQPNALSLPEALFTLNGAGGTTPPGSSPIQRY